MDVIGRLYRAPLFVLELNGDRKARLLSTTPAEPCKLICTFDTHHVRIAVEALLNGQRKICDTTNSRGVGVENMYALLERERDE